MHSKMCETTYVVCVRTTQMDHQFDQKYTGRLADAE